jgi:hypothetical protein
MILRFTKSLCLLAFLLYGCTAVASWEILVFPGVSGPIDGALNVGNLRPPVLRSCTQTFNSYAKCDYAFTDSAQRKINIFSDLMVALDDHAEQTVELKPWVARADTKTPPDAAKVPYKMYLLTISPTVVLVVPIKPSPSEYYKTRCSTLLFAGCIQSQGFRGSAYWFKQSPPVAEDSFWFTPEESKGVVHYLAKGQSEHEISVNQAMIQLSQKDGNWIVQRTK